MKKFIEKTKERWDIKSNWDFLLICIAFAITGSLSVKVGKPVLEFIGITPDLSPWVFWPVRILIVFPIYQVLLIIIGTLLGQFRFFWNMEKKMLGRFSKLPFTSTQNSFYKVKK